MKNLPASADEELLEVFFESTKKQGGGPVKSVKLFGDKQDEQVACVEFCNSSAVETVLKKRPIKLGKIELDVQPFEPLLQGSEKIRDVQVNLTELLDKFTDDLLQKQAEGHPPEPEPPGPGPFEMFEMLKIGSRVTLNRSNDWYISLLEYRGHGRKGWVSKIKENRTVVVTLDNGETNCYCLGKDGNYRLKYGS